MATTPVSTDTPRNPRANNPEASTADVNTPAGSTPSAATERPRPEYGEYATPAEQAEAMGITPAELAKLTTLTPAAKPVAEPERAEKAEKAEKPEKGAKALAAAKSATAKSATEQKDQDSELPPPAASDAIQLPPPTKASTDLPTGARRWDVPITYGLLFYGAFTVFSVIAEARTYGSALQASFAQFVGKDSFTAIDLANDLGPWIAATHGVIFVITVALTITSIRRKRVSFYIPLIGAVVAGIATVIFGVVILANDPAFVALMQSRQ